MNLRKERESFSLHAKILYITPCTKKGGIMDRFPRKVGTVFFYAKGAKIDLSQSLPTRF